MERTRIESPRKVGEAQRKKTTLGVYQESAVKLRGLARRWGTTVVEAERYLVDIGAAGYIDPPAPQEPVIIHSTLPPVPKSIEGAAVDFLRAIWPATPLVTWEEAETRMVDLIRLAGCEGRASWVKGESE